MDVSKFKFTITAEYDCDEGEGCYNDVNEASYDEALEMLSNLDSPTYIDGYYHTMSLYFEVTDKHGKPIEFPDKLKEDYDWILEDGEFWTSNKTEATEIPSEMINLMKAIKQSDAEYAINKRKEIEDRISELQTEILELEEELKKLGHD